MLKALWERTDGATAIEYALMIGGIAFTMVAAMFALGDDLVAFFTAVAGNIATAAANIP